MEATLFFFITTIVFFALYLSERNKSKSMFIQNVQLKYLNEKEKKATKAKEIDVVFPYSNKTNNKTGVKRPDLSFEDLVHFRDNKIDKQYFESLLR